MSGNLFAVKARLASASGEGSSPFLAFGHAMIITTLGQGCSAGYPKKDQREGGIAKAHGQGVQLLAVFCNR